MSTSADSHVASPRFERVPVVSLADEVIHVRLTGLAPGSVVTIRSRLTDEFGGEWESATSFTADELGAVDLSAQAPSSGSYDGVEPMGFLWSMTPVGDESGTRAIRKSTVAPDTFVLTAEQHGTSIAETRLTRLVAAPGVKRTEVRDDGLFGTLFTPPDDGPHPTIMLLSGSGGGLSEAQAALYASRGYGALALAYFRAGHLPQTLQRIPLEYFERAIAWLQDRPEIDADRLAVGGTSRGGELCLLLGSRYPQFKAVVARVPSAVVYGGIGSDTAHQEPAWTYRGEGIPFLHSRPNRLPEYETTDGSGFALTPIFLKSLEDHEQVRQATIPVEKINGPVLAISGKVDAMWPSSVYSDMVMERLAEHMHPYAYEHVACEGTGHNVGQPWWPTTVTDSIHPVTKTYFAQGGEPKRSANEQARAWARTITFLDEYLKGAPVREPVLGGDGG
ncbi:MAG: acyl-CoA thioesterase/bile acid-CoA:amino acid N-acyltransferase family protein [Nitrolancea sp.]